MKKSILLGFLSILLLSASAFALPVGPGLQTVLNNIAVDGTNNVNAETGHLVDGSDAHWNITATGTSAATFIIELAGYAAYNSFGIYDIANTSNRVELFSAADTNKDQVSVSIDGSGNIVVADITDLSFSFGKFAGTTFGYYINVANTQNTYFSNSSLNENGTDHMLAYRGVGELVDLDGTGTKFGASTWTDEEWILAFEDLYNGGDNNFTDLVVMVESVQPVPEPATMFLLGTGIIGLAGARRKKKN